jgi:hypothetical protein
VPSLVWELWELLQRTVLIWGITLVVVSALLGAVVASHGGLPLWRSAALSAALPVLGVAVLAVLGCRRTPADARLGAAALRTPFQAQSIAGPRILGSQPLGTPPDLDFSDLDPYAVPASRSLGDEPPAPVLLRRLLVAAAAVPVALLISALPLNWFSLDTSPLWRSSYSGQDAWFTAMPLMASIAVVAGAALSFDRRPRGRWAVLAAVASAPWLAVGAQIIVTSDALEQVVTQLQSGFTVVPRVELVPGGGAWALVGGGLAGVLWSLAACAYVHIGRSKSRGGGSH